MNESVCVALDGMGGDNAPKAVVEGALNAIKNHPDIKVKLVGRKQDLSEHLKKADYPKERLEIVEASEVIEMAEPPVAAIRKKKDSSIVVGLNLVREK